MACTCLCDRDITAQFGTKFLPSDVGEAKGETVITGNQRGANQGSHRDYRARLGGRYLGCLLKTNCSSAMTQNGSHWPRHTPAVLHIPRLHHRFAGRDTHLLHVPLRQLRLHLIFPSSSMPFCMCSWQEILRHEILWHEILWHEILWHEILWHEILWPQGRGNHLRTRWGRGVGERAA